MLELLNYPGTSNLIMELVRSIPLYYVAMPQSMVIVTKAPFVIAPTHIVVNMRSKPSNSKGNTTCQCAYKNVQRGGHDFYWTTIRCKKRKLKPTRTIKTSMTFKIFWIANDEFRHTTITTK
jgi:hypothetical protein